MPDDTTVPLQQASDNAWKTLQLFVTTEEAGPYAATWSVDNLPEGGAGSLFGTDGLPIYDYKGRLLYYEFALPLQNGSEFRARAAATKELGSPVLQVAATRPFQLAAWREQALKFAAQNGYVIDNPDRIVCYSVPKLGLQAHNASGAKFIIDLAAPVAISYPPENADGLESLKADSDDLLLVWSPLDGRVRQASLETFALKEVALSVIAGPLAESLPESVPPTQAVLDLKLSGQQNAVYCAVASAQMILAYHGIDATQDTIAGVMQTGPGGSTVENQVAAFAQLSNNRFAGNLQKPPTFPLGQNQVNIKAPYKSGVPGHARVGAGWKIQTTGATSSNWLYIYDPWPPNAGQVYWEDWTAVQHSNDIFVGSPRVA